MKPGADKIITQKSRRAFSQRGGPSPDNQVRYAGPEETYMMFDAATNPRRGGTDSIQVHNTRQRGGFEQIGTSISPPDRPSNSITFLHKHGGVPWVDYDLSCYNNFYEGVGPCARPDDFVNGWDDYVQIYSYGEADSSSDDALTTFEDDAQTTTQVDWTYGALYKIGKFFFGQTAAPEVEREVVDLVYASTIDCGTCGVSDDGTKRIYAVTKSSGAGSPGTPAEIIWTINGGAAWSQTNITGLGGTVDPTGIEVVGPYLVVLDTAGNGYWFADLNTYTGAPSNWTNVTTGFVAAKQPNDIYVVSANEIWFCGEGGYIYKSTDIASGVAVIDAGSTTTNDLKRIDGEDDTIVAVGESGTIIISQNRGVTFANATTSPTNATIRALAVLDDKRFWIGTSGGLVYYTVNGGETWTLQALPGGTLTVIDDIIAATNEVIHVSGRTATPVARLITTWCGGEKWASSALTTKRINSFPTVSWFNRIAVPRVHDWATLGNVIALGGLSAGGTDGYITLGAANKV